MYNSHLNRPMSFGNSFTRFIEFPELCDTWNAATNIVGSIIVGLNNMIILIYTDIQKDKQVFNTGLSYKNRSMSSVSPIVLEGLCHIKSISVETCRRTRNVKQKPPNPLSIYSGKLISLKLIQGALYNQVGKSIGTPQNLLQMNSNLLLDS